MDKIFYSHDYSNDTTYLCEQDTDGMLKITMTFTSEDPDYGTETLVYGGNGTEQELRNDLFTELRETLDRQEANQHGMMPQPWKDWDENFGRSSLIAFHNMLWDLVDEDVRNGDENRDNDSPTTLYKRLARHVGHDVAIVSYGDGINISLECNDCGCVIFDTDIYDLTGLEGK